MKSPDKDVHIMWARKYASQLCVTRASAATRVTVETLNFLLLTIDDALQLR